MTNADNADNPGDLIPDDQPRHLSARSLKTSLELAARDRSLADDLALARLTTPALRTVSDEAVWLAARQPPLWEYRLYFQALGDLINRETRSAEGDWHPLPPARSLGMLEMALAADDGQTQLVICFDMALTADTDAFQAALDRAHQRVFGRRLPDDNLF